MPPNTPPEKEAEYLQSAMAIANGGSGALPYGSDAKVAAAGKIGDAPFKPRLEWLQEQLVLAGTGGLLSMLAMPQGIGSGSTGAHEDGFAKLAKRQARKHSETFQKQFDKFILAQAFPGQPVLAYMEVAANEETDVSGFVADVASLSSAGYQVDPAQIEEKTGYKVTLKVSAPAPGMEATEGNEGNKGGNEEEVAPAESDKITNRETLLLEQAAAQQLAGAVQSDLSHVMDRVAAIIQISDPDLLRRKLQELREDFPSIAADVLADPASARVIAKTISAGLANGAAAGKIKNRKILNGDLPGHPFRGNQHADAIAQIRDVVSGKRPEAAYSKVTPDIAAKIKAVSNLEVGDHQHFIDRNALVHIDSTHGVGREKQLNHVPVTRDDLDLIPEIVANPDKVEKGNVSGRNLPTVKYTKQYKDTVYYVEEHWKKEKLLAAKTMYKEKTPGNSATPKGGGSHTSKTSGAKK